MQKVQAEKIETISEAVGIFNDAHSLQAAIDELRTHGFGRRHISVLADAETIEKKLGHVYKRVEDMVDNPDVPRTIFVQLEALGEAEGALFGLPLFVAACAASTVVVASGGTLLAAIMAATAAGAGGGLIGAILAQIIGKHHADYIQDQINHGGLVLWVTTEDAEHEQSAVAILKKHSAHDVHIHNIPIKN